MGGLNKHAPMGTRSVVDILRRDPCVFCGEYYIPSKKKNPKHHGKRWATIDHIHPKNRGGTNSWVNYAPTCEKCNGEKKENSLLGFLLGENIPSNIIITKQEKLPDDWYDPLGTIAPKDPAIEVIPTRNQLKRAARRERFRLALES